MRLVHRKTTTRWYANGRGFQSEALAYQHLAKAELGVAAQNYASEFPMDEQDERIKEWYRQHFPIDSESTPKATHTFDNDKRKKWLRQRGKELRAEDIALNGKQPA